jgi:hypothetical protein
MRSVMRIFNFEFFSISVMSTAENIIRRYESFSSVQLMNTHKKIRRPHKNQRMLDGQLVKTYP